MVVLVVVSSPFVFVLVVDSVLLDGSFTTVVLFSVFFSPGGLTVVVSDFSQAAKRAAPTNNAMYFFIKRIQGVETR